MTLESKNTHKENAAAPEYVHSMILRPGRRNHSQRAFPWITLICWLAIAVLAAAAICEVLK